MKTTKPVTFTTIGNIRCDAEGYRLESAVEMSANNFAFLLSLLPKTDEKTATCDAIQYIKDKATELSYKSEKNMSMVTSLLTDLLNRYQFLEQANKFRSKNPVMPDIKIVGKISLPKCEMI